MTSTVKCDLSQFFGALASRVPDRHLEGGDFIFHSGLFPAFPAALSSDRIIIKKRVHDYNSWYRADLLWMSISASKARELGVLLLACVFQGPVETAILTFTHPESDIRRLIIRPRRPTLDDPPLGLSLEPFAFRYSPSSVGRHPWIKYGHVFDFPLLALSNAEELITTDEQWQERDTIFEESSVHGTVLLAELLLNAGCLENQVREFDLEGDAGVRGVAPMSAELKIVLPGSEIWEYEGDEVPIVECHQGDKQA